MVSCRKVSSLQIIYRKFVSKSTNSIKVSTAEFKRSVSNKSDSSSYCFENVFMLLNYNKINKAGDQ